MEEIWKEIAGTDGQYYISNYGRVYSAPRCVQFGKRLRYTKPHILRAIQKPNGYLTVNIGKQKQYIHRLVAEAFVENPLNYPQVNHKDENKTNNTADNLEWCDAVYNVNYGTGLKRGIEKRMSKYAVINLETGEIFSCPIEAYKITGIHNDGISRACKNKSATAGGYHWEYVKNGRCS